MRDYIDVPYSQKDDAKSLGARWDQDAKSWYIPNGLDKEPFSQWLQEEKASIFIVVGRRECWKCHKETTVVALGIPYGEPYPLTVEDVQEGAFPGYDPPSCDALALVPRIDSMPKEMRDFLESKYNYKPKYSHTSEETLLNNCCDWCDSLQGEFYEFCEPSGTFFITEKADLESLEFFEVKFEGSVFGLVDQWSSADRDIYAYAKQNAKQLPLALYGNLYV